MKNRKSFGLLIAVVIAVMMMLCACGSKLEGTWTSENDSSTKIRFSGSKVRVSYDNYKINGTYEFDPDDSRTVIISLTDKDGSKYRITAQVSVSEDTDTLILKNSDGRSEVFRK